MRASIILRDSSLSPARARISSRYTTSSSLLTGREIVPGIRMLPTPGHTPGHMAVVVSSGQEELLYISDAALHPIHLEQPAWYPAYDLDPDQALSSKCRLFDFAATDSALVLAFHFSPFPSLGHVIKQGSGWRWEPVDMTP